MKIIRVRDLQGSVYEISDLEIIGCFSVDGQQCYHNDLSQLRYYKRVPKDKRVHFDLNKDMNVATLYPAVYDLKLDFLLTWFSDNLNLLNSSELTNRPLQIVCTRGVIKQLFLTPFPRTQSWIICASKLNGTIYLCNFEMEETRKKYLSMSEENYRRSSWGHKFEQYMTSDDPSKDPDLSKPLNCKEKFYCIFKARFGETNLLYTAEIDGISCQEKIKDTIVGKKIDFVEFKTVPWTSIANGKLQSWIQALTYWCQSYLAGIKTIVCGLKYDSVVQQIETLEVNEFDYLKVEQDTCKSFFSKFLEIIRDTVDESYRKCLYKFEYDRSKKIIKVERIDPNIQKEYIFLPSWYTERVEQQFAKAV